MDWFKNLNAAPRLLLSFGVLIVLIAAIGCLAIGPDRSRTDGRRRSDRICRRSQTASLLLPAVAKRSGSPTDRHDMQPDRDGPILGGQGLIVPNREPIRTNRDIL
jgi:hypothetical protein